MHRTSILLLVLSILLAGCGSRSISNSGYYADSDREYSKHSDPSYKGELSEFNVLGIDPNAAVAESDIATALATKQRFAIAKGSTIMLIQSGTMIPDDLMVKSLEKYYNVAVFTGVPQQADSSANNYSRSLRLAAARGGAEKLVVYWGVLETGTENLATKVVSWVPFVGGVLPDQNQRMRIRLKLAVVDVKTGQWEMFTPEAFEDVDSSGRYSRVSSDQAQVAVLKEKGYAAAVDDLVKRYAH
ncbi:MAG TPA: aminopeptidase [Gammaproteobacteria bacterium]|nr:aminopeptidase [Gammaproteobacteria bacterium]